jgi:hypothetical protein
MVPLASHRPAFAQEGGRRAPAAYPPSSRKPISRKTAAGMIICRMKSSLIVAMLRARFPVGGKY